MDNHSQVLENLNEAQRKAVCHGDSPLLIVAGAGSGKTKTLVHRVAHLITQGVHPQRILLLTFTRRAADQMLRRVDGLLRQTRPASAGGAALSHQFWGGTFHATAARLLRMHGQSIGLDPGFTIHDRGDSEDLLDVVRTELKLDKYDKRFPKKRTCLAIYSRVVNARRPLEETLASVYPWCLDYAEQLKQLFQGYVDRKERLGVLDYDDLLLFWRGLLADADARAIEVIVPLFRGEHCRSKAKNRQESRWMRDAFMPKGLERSAAEIAEWVDGCYRELVWW